MAEEKRRFRRILHASAVLATVSGVFASCSTSECLDNQNSRPKAVFLASGGASAGSLVTVPSLTIYGIGAPGDSLLVNKENLSRVTLPFRIGEEKTTYVFEYAVEENQPPLSDTLKFTYRSVPEFVSAACGAIYAFEDVSVTSTDWVIDSVSCPRTRIDNVERDYINIYFPVSESE